MTQDTAHMPLDERGLEAAEQAHTACTKYGCKDDHCNGLMCRSIIRAYLQTAAADVSGLARSIDRWRNMVPVAVTAGSPAQIEYALADAKHDIITLWSTIQTLSASNAALEAENERLRDYAQKATATITGLTSGGSEFFAGRIGDIYIADLKFCEQRIREREQSLFDEIRRRAARRVREGGKVDG